MSKITLYLFCCLCFFSLKKTLNAQENNLNKKYNNVVFLTTHNAYNYGLDGAFNLPNQTYPVSQQLEDGVRGFMLDVYLLDNIPQLYHSISLLGTEPLSLVLNDMHDFLVANPNEIISIIFESYVSADVIATALSDANLNQFLHAQSTENPWPTLQQMIDDSQRLVIFSESENDSETDYPWYLYVWDYAVDTDFSNHRLTDLTCEFNRGSAENELFILNNFITHASFGFGLIDSAMLINEYDFLYNYCEQCIEEKGKIPNFISVDFYEVGEGLAVTQAINALNSSPDLTGKEVLAYPNPFEQEICFETTNSALQFPISFRVFDTKGRVISEQHIDVLPFCITELDWTTGIYFYEIRGGEQVLQGKIMAK